MVQITIDLTGTLEKMRAESEKAKTPKRSKKASKPKDIRADDLSMRLMAIGGATDEVAMQLEMDTVDFVKEMLASNKKKVAVNFLNENKHRFTPEMKDSLTDVINKGL
jgi:hypothetical protein